jgi:hypothetical protein
MTNKAIQEDRKVIIDRWQWDEISTILFGSTPGGIQDWMDSKFKIKTISYMPRVSEVDVLFIFFGFKQEMEKWRKENGLAPQSVILARDHEKLTGRRFRPVPVYDWGWMSNNKTHEIVKRARDVIYRAEATFGSGPFLYLSYEGDKK